MSDGDVELFERWACGEKDAGSQLFDRHFASLYRFFRNKAPDAVEDLIQETMLACVSGKDGFRREASFRTYLFTIARHELYAHYKKRRRAGEREEDIGARSVVDLATGPGSLVARHRTHDLLLRALRALSLDFQVALELHYFEDMPGPEIATVLGVPEGTVRSRLRRAKEALREQMEALATAGDEQALSASRSDLDGWARGVARTIDRPDESIG